MKITHLNSATEIIEIDNVKILTDPWLNDGIYYGSWFTYPPYKSSYNYLLNDIDYIYISHIHPDHFCVKTLEMIDKDIPILILNYNEKFVLNKLQRLGFNNIEELDHNNRTLLKNNVHINIIAADNCNPEICGLAFGCFFNNNESGKTYQIDSMAVIDNNEYVVLNTNDCPYPIAKESINLIKEKYNKIDFLMVGYTGASPYPFAFSEFTDKELEKAKETTKIKMLNYGFEFIREFNPKFFMPFAGTYVLGGKNWKLNKFSPIPKLEDAKSYLEEKLIESSIQSKCILLNSGQSFDLKNISQTKEYSPINDEEMWRYLKDVLSIKKYDYESEEYKTLEDFIEIIKPAFKRFEKKVQEIKFQSKTKIIINLDGNNSLLIDLSDNNPSYEIISDDIKDANYPYVYFNIDNRLLYNIFKGPRYAHWNNVEIGSLLKIKRNPERYEEGIHLAMCYLHS